MATQATTTPDPSPPRGREGDGERIGIFGGTFDPPHVGHLVSALEVAHVLGLDRVLLVVANQPWQKTGTRPITPAGDRLAMVRAAVAGVDGLEASAIEIDRGGDSYTADTVGVLLRDAPDAALFVILGADAAAGLHTWERADEVRDLAHLVVVDRPGSAAPSVPDGWAWTHVEVPHLDVSSTELRDRLRTQRPVAFLIPAGVVDCIRTRGLYADVP